MSTRSSRNVVPASSQTPLPRTQAPRRARRSSSKVASRQPPCSLTGRCPRTGVRRPLAWARASPRGPRARALSRRYAPESESSLLMSRVFCRMKRRGASFSFASWPRNGHQCQVRRASRRAPTVAGPSWCRPRSWTSSTRGCTWSSCIAATATAWRSMSRRTPSSKRSSGRATATRSRWPRSPRSSIWRSSSRTSTGSHARCAPTWSCPRTSDAPCAFDGHIARQVHEAADARALVLAAALREAQEGLPAALVALRDARRLGALVGLLELALGGRELVLELRGVQRGRVDGLLDEDQHAPVGHLDVALALREAHDVGLRPVQPQLGGLEHAEQRLVVGQDADRAHARAGRDHLDLLVEDLTLGGENLGGELRAGHASRPWRRSRRRRSSP